MQMLQLNLTIQLVCESTLRIDYLLFGIPVNS